MKKMDVVELTQAIAGYEKDLNINFSEFSVKDKIKVYKQIFNEEVEVKQFFIQYEYYNPSSHSMDWGIIGENNEEVLGEESAKMFFDPTAAKLWLESNDALKWQPCTFMIKESIYTIKGE